jgi:hypothetical protein
MSATRLHKLTAVSFAVLYGVVGFTGETLHYLLTDPALLWSGSQSAESVVYYHTHGPDYHGHFHRHSHDGHHHHSHAAGVAEADRSSDAIRITSEGSSHEPHACPLLVLVSTLKLGQGSICSSALILESLIAPSRECDVVRAYDVASSSSARGPPNGCLA